MNNNTSQPIPGFREVPKTGVIYVMSEARKYGFGSGDPEWANLGQGFNATDIYRGSDLGPGHFVPGPAIIEEAFTTIVVYPGWNARLDDAGDYELTHQEN